MNNLLVVQNLNITLKVVLFEDFCDALFIINDQILIFHSILYFKIDLSGSELPSGEDQTELKFTLG